MFAHSSEGKTFNMRRDRVHWVYIHYKCGKISDFIETYDILTGLSGLMQEECFPYINGLEPRVTVSGNGVWHLGLRWEQNVSSVVGRVQVHGTKMDKW